MATIISGRFDEQSQSAAALKRLRAAGFPADQICSFYLSPAGQHARYPIGGDHDKSVGAEGAGIGAVDGIAGGGLVGAAVGTLTVPVLGPLGALAGSLVGAHIGNLVGALGHMKDNPGDEDHPGVRQGGLVVAVSTPNAACLKKAVAVLRECDARSLESATGRISGGDWIDFDPTSIPAPIDRAPSADQRSVRS
jgi:hypothetical protein